jgi:hypothetical protein
LASYSTNKLDAVDKSGDLAKAWNHSKGQWTQVNSDILNAIRLLRQEYTTAIKASPTALLEIGSFENSDAARISKVEDRTADAERTLLGLASTSTLMATKLKKLEGNLAMANHRIDAARAVIGSVEQATASSVLTTAAAMQVVTDGISRICDHQDYKPVVLNHGGTID